MFGTGGRQSCHTARGCHVFTDPVACPPMCCLALSAGFIGPRFALLIWWIFGSKVDAAFSTWFWPLLGLLFFPWTTIAYVLAWGPVYGVSGFWGWLLVALGLAADIATYSAKPAQARYA
jgi:hypothetical protein